MHAHARVCVGCWFSLTLSVIISGAFAGELGFCAAERQKKPFAGKRLGMVPSAAPVPFLLFREWIHDRDRDRWSTRTRGARMRQEDFCGRCMIC